MQSDVKQPSAIAWPITLSGFIIGLFLSFSLLSGDEQGRVNLMFLLLVFVLIPLLSLLLSLFSLIMHAPTNLAAILSRLPLMSNQRQRHLMHLRQLGVDQTWLLLQSQYAAMAYALASLTVLFLLLLISDVNFVWRSTLLKPQQMQPLLELIALPWWFWDSAQPSLSLLIDSQDSRLDNQAFAQQALGNWWPFISASLVFYALVCRLLFLLPLRLMISKRMASDLESQLTQKIQEHHKSHAQHEVRARILESLPEPYVIYNWDALSDALMQTLPEVQDAQALYQRGDPLTDVSPLHVVIVVKAWEPPLGELEDTLEHLQGIIYPVDFDAQQPQTLDPTDLDEWRRFTAKLSGWQLYSRSATSEGTTANE
ncbi:MAG: DUF2868 domain-containing protein [Gammaproteobacteria bacterium]|nr:DUF2868 domain-containing protein [Gammaproteobacteria bacterium]